jgi:hypothetical protein
MDEEKLRLEKKILTRESKVAFCKNIFQSCVCAGEGDVCLWDLD